MLWMYQRVVYGEVTNAANLKLRDLSAREKFALAPLIALIFLMGVFPGVFLSRSDLSIQTIKARFGSGIETAAAPAPAESHIQEK